MHDDTLSVFITNLGKYNEGELVGDWLNLPIDYETFNETLKRIGIGGRYEEWFITDYESSISYLTDCLGEYENMDELNYLAALIDDLASYDMDILEAALEFKSPTDAAETINIVLGLDNFSLYEDIHDYDDLGRAYFELADAKIPEPFDRYIDYESYGRDIRLESDGDFTDKGWIEDIGYSGDDYTGVDDIPDEYIVTRNVDEE